MNYVLFLSQNSISCFYYINNFNIRLFILLTFFTVPVWSAFSEKNEDLFKLKSGDWYENGISAFSFDGKIGGGVKLFWDKDLAFTQAYIFGTDNKFERNLGNHKGDYSGNSAVKAFSSDGKIAGGYAQFDSQKHHAAIWTTNDDWQTFKKPIDLGTLEIDNSGSSRVTSFSSDGQIAGGWASPNTGDKKAVIWFTNDSWKHVGLLDLGTLRKDNSGSSEVSGLSSDGTTIIGTADTDYGLKHNFIKRVPRAVYANLDYLLTPTNKQDTDTKDSNNNAVPPPEAAPYSAVSNLEPHKSSKINKDKGFVKIPPMLDVTNTRSTISKLASDTFSIMAFQRQTLTRLQQGCISTDGYWCWSVNANTSNAITKNIVPGINVGYGLTEKLSVGGVIERAFSRSFPDSHEMSGNNIGRGFYAQWHVPFSVGESYLRPAVSFSQYELGIKRSKLSNTEEGKGNSKMNGFGLSIEGGQNFILSNKMLLGWHAGVRYSQISRNIYKENNVDYPIKYKKINYDNTSGYVGADVSVPILSPLSWVSGIEIEHTLKESELIYNAQIDKIENLSIKAPLNHTRGIVKTGFVYKLHKNFSFSVLTSLSQTTVGDKKWNTILSLIGQF